MKKRILFLIHDLGPGGAEKVLVNLVNGMDKAKFDISLRTLFDWGPNRAFLDPEVRYSSWIGRNVPANSHWMKLWTPEQLYKMIVPETYDIAVSFLEGPCARVIGGCPVSQNGTRVVSWIHTPILNEKKFIEGFRSREEAERCYGRADALIFVSRDVRSAFSKFYRTEKRSEVLYNIFESDTIRSLASEEPESISVDPSRLNWCGIGKLIPLKGWDRMLNIQKKLRDDGINTHFYLIGDGPQRHALEQMASDLGISDAVTFTGYQTNPYAILSRCALFVCASEREGLSTAVIESLLTGTPVCTVDVGGMKEILGKNNEFGVVTRNDDGELFQAVRQFLTDDGFREKYRLKAAERAELFDKERSVKAVEELLFSL